MYLWPLTIQTVFHEDGVAPIFFEKCPVCSARINCGFFGKELTFQADNCGNACAVACGEKVITIVEGVFWDHWLRIILEDDGAFGFGLISSPPFFVNRPQDEAPIQGVRTGAWRVSDASQRWLTYLGRHFGSKKTEYFDKSSKTIDILLVFFEPMWSRILLDTLFMSNATPLKV